MSRLNAENLRRLGNQVVPILPDVLNDAREIGTEVDTLRIAQDIEIADLAAVRAGAQAKVAALATSGSFRRSRRLRRLIDL